MPLTNEWLWALPMFSGGLCLSAAIWLWGLVRTSKIQVPGLLSLLFLLAWWGLANGAMMVAQGKSLKFFFYNLEGLPVLSVPVFLVLKAKSIVSPGYRPKKGVIWILLCLLFGIFFYSLTDHFYATFYEEVDYPSGYLLAHLKPKFPFYVVFPGWAIAVALWALFILLHALPKLEKLDRQEAIRYSIATLAIVAGAAAFYFFDYRPIPEFDPAPSLVGLGGLFALYATIRFRLHQPYMFSLGGEVDDVSVKLFTFQSAAIFGLPAALIFLAKDLSEANYLAASMGFLFVLALPAGLLLMQASQGDKRERSLHVILSSILALLAGIVISTVGIQGDLYKAPWLFLFPVVAIFWFGVKLGLSLTLGLSAALLICLHLAGLLRQSLGSPLGVRMATVLGAVVIVLCFMEHARVRYLDMLKASREEVRRHRDLLEVQVNQRTQELTQTVGLLQEEVEQRKTAQAALLEAKEQAERANRSKTEFLANMSHEFRTPLTHILGFADVLREEITGPMNDQQKEFLGYIVSSGNHLQTLVNDLLDMAKLETGRLDLKLEPVSLDLLLGDVVKAHSLRAKEAKVTLEHSWSGLPSTMSLDPGKINQVVSNLLTNAIKFSHAGWVRLEAWGRGQGMPGAGLGRHGPHVEIVISDSGIGIEAKDLQRIFRPFEQVDSSTTRQFDGSGLGLALARNLVQMHGGHLWAESGGLGQGSQFHLVLPWDAPRPAPGEEP